MTFIFQWSNLNGQKARKTDNQEFSSKETKTARNKKRKRNSPKLFRIVKNQSEIKYGSVVLTCQLIKRKNYLIA